MKLNNQFSSIEQVTSQYLNQNKVSVKKEEGNFFDKVLQEKKIEKKVNENSNLKFSKHAVERLADRQIDLTKDQMTRLENGAKKASEKGINESLVMVDSLAFIVSVKNQTVITAMDSKETTDHIFTNIDGAVLM